MAASGVDYAAVLDDARMKRATLDALISALEALIGVSSPAPVVALPPAKSPEDPAVSRSRPSRPAVEPTGNAEALVHQALGGGLLLSPKTILERTWVTKHALKLALSRLVAAKTVIRTGTGPRNTLYRLA